MRIEDISSTDLNSYYLCLNKGQLYAEKKGLWTAFKANILSPLFGNTFGTYDLVKIVSSDTFKDLARSPNASKLEAPLRAKITNYLNKHTEKSTTQRAKNTQLETAWNDFLKIREQRQQILTKMDNTATDLGLNINEKDLEKFVDQYLKLANPKEKGLPLAEKIANYYIKAGATTMTEASRQELIEEIHDYLKTRSLG